MFTHAPPARPTAHPAPPAAPLILLIDDNPDDRALALHAFQKEDPSARVVEITTPEALDRALAGEACDVVVTDFRLRWSDGLAVLRAVKERRPHCPVIFFTASGNEEVAVAAMKAGADDYVIKGPRRARRLVTAVRLARERAQLQAREQEALRLRDVFLAGAAHELRTPLTSIIGYLDLLQERMQLGVLVLGDRDRAYLEVIARQAAALDRLVKDLAAAARLGSGVLGLERQPVELGALTRRVVEEAGPLLTAHTLELATPAEALTVDGDPQRLEQALQNLLQNAVRYSPKGGPIRVSLARSGEDVCLTVADRGIGIPAADQARVFERFYRAGNVNPLQTGGFGLGLYVARAIVEQHGGTITVESIEGTGSTFTLCLPLTPSSSQP